MGEQSRWRHQWYVIGQQIWWCEDVPCGDWAILAKQKASFICMIDGNNIFTDGNQPRSQTYWRRWYLVLIPGGMGATHLPRGDTWQNFAIGWLPVWFKPVVDTMRHNGTPYTGFLYAGLMIVDQNDPMAVEFSAVWWPRNTANYDAPKRLNGWLDNIRVGWQSSPNKLSGMSILPYRCCTG